MNTLARGYVKQQKAGGVAALYIAAALLAAIPFFLLVVDYQSAGTVAEKVALVVAEYGSMYVMYLVSYVFYGFAVGILAFALYDRMRESAPAAMRAATAVGLLWSVALVASGMVWNYGMTTVVALAETDPAQARLVWQLIEPVSEALGGAGGEILGGLWILLLSSVALRSGALPKLLGWFGVIIGTAGLLSVAPPLHDAAILFGLALIAWCTWVAVVMLRTKGTPAAAGQVRDTASPVCAHPDRSFQPTPPALDS